MSTSRLRRSDGFTLVEVIVAVGIFAMVTAVTLPLLIIGLRASASARDVSQAKGVAQGRIEAIRNLPFYVGRSAGDYIDVLDTYYRDLNSPAEIPTCSTSTLTALPPNSWTGYVMAGATHCPWEPAGPLYRKVVSPIAAPGLGLFSMTVSTQFLSPATPPSPVSPPPTYNSQTAGRDAPPAQQVGLTVTVFFKVGSRIRMTSTYTQIEQSNPISPIIESAARVTTVRASSVTPTGVNVATQVGVVNLGGELFTGSRVVSTATVGTGATSIGDQVNAAQINLVAPADAPATAAVNAGAGMTNGCTWVCFGASVVDQASAYASNGLPIAGTPTAPVRARFTSDTTMRGFQFSNGSNGARLKLDTAQPMVSLDMAGPSNMLGVTNCDITNVGVPTNNAFLTGTGFLDATADATPSVSACATGQSNTIRLLPTSFAPNGVVQLVLSKAAAWCRVSRSGATVTRTASAQFSATVRYWNGAGYSSAGQISRSNSADPLAAVDMNQPVDTGLVLGDYISSWKSLTSQDSLTSTTARSAEVRMPGVITLITQPTREDVAGGVGPRNVDPTSAISVTVGALTCAAGDYR